MVETIHKIKNRIEKLLVRIDNLKKDLRQSRETHHQYVHQSALNIIEQKDKEISLYLESRKKLESEIDINILEEKHQAVIKTLDSLLEKFEVVKLASPLDTLADFIEIEGTVKNPKKKNGMVEKVTKFGYMKGEELIRSTHVIVVQND